MFSQQAREQAAAREEAGADPDLDSTEYVLGKNWRDFIPVIKVSREKTLEIFLCNLEPPSG